MTDKKQEQPTTTQSKADPEDDGRPSLGERPRRFSNLPKRGLDSEKFLSMRIPAIADAHHTAAETHGHGHWKVRVLHFVHSDTVERVLMGLLLLDVLLLFIELFLQATYPHCHFIERDAISCCPNEFNTTTVDHGNNNEHRFLASEPDDGHHNLCVSPAVESHHYEATCDPHKWETVHKLEEALFWCTIVILSTFLLELMAMIVALEKAFFQQFFYVLDLFIVTTSLALELTFHFVSFETLVAITGILVFGRLWRFVRIGHGLVEVTAEYAAHDKKLLLDYAEQLETLLQDNNVDLPAKSHRLQTLEEHYTQHGDLPHNGDS